MSYVGDITKKECAMRKDSDAFKPLVEVRAFAASELLSKAQCVLLVAQRLRKGPTPQQHTDAAKWVRRRIVDHCRAGKLSMHGGYFPWQPFASWLLGQKDWCRQAQFDDVRASLDQLSRNASLNAALGDASVTASASVTDGTLDPAMARFVKQQQQELSKANCERAELERENALLREKVDLAERIINVHDKRTAGGRKGGKAGKGTSKGGNF